MTTKKKATKGSDPVDALSLKIADLERQLTEEKNSHGRIIEEGAAEIGKRLDFMNDKYDRLLKIKEAAEKENEALKNKLEKIENAKAAYTKNAVALVKEAAYNRFVIKTLTEKVGKMADPAETEPVVVPALINKARVIKACRHVEENLSCANVKDFISGLRNFIENHCNK